MLLRCLALLLVLTVPLTAPAGIAPVPAAAAVASPQDRNFIQLFRQASLAATEAGTLAARQATDPGLRDYGTHLQHTLGEAGRELGALVAPLHLPPLSDDPDAEHKALMLRLDQATATQFDQLFLQAQLQRQDDLLSILSIEAATGDQPGLRHFASRQLPVVHDLRQRALALMGRTPEPAAVRQAPQC